MHLCSFLNMGMSLLNLVKTYSFIQQQRQTIPFPLPFMLHKRQTIPFPLPFMLQKRQTIPLLIAVYASETANNTLSHCRLCFRNGNRKTLNFLIFFFSLLFLFLLFLKIKGFMLMVYKYLRYVNRMSYS